MLQTVQTWRIQILVRTSDTGFLDQISPGKNIVHAIC